MRASGWAKRSAGTAGSGLVEVWLNGVELSVNESVASGAVGFGPSPLYPAKNHSIFELSFAALSGGFSVQLKDPGPRFACSVLETEPAVFTGWLHEGGGSTVVPTGDQELPAAGSAVHSLDVPPAALPAVDPELYGSFQSNI